jgi:ATP-dependent DNA helicase RecQ
LRALRKRLSEEQGVPPYVIFHDATLREMAERAPRTADQLATVSGVGAAKLERYGAAFLDVIGRTSGAAGGGASRGDPGAAGLFPPAAGERPDGTRAASGQDDELDTVERTRELLLEGYAPEAVAGMRNLKLRTIEGHMAELVRRGDLTLQEATGLDAEAAGEVERALESLPSEQHGRLKPLYQALGGRYPYGQLKCVLEALRRL